MTHRIVTAYVGFECNYSFAILVICLTFVPDDFVMLDILPLYACEMINV